MICQVKRDRVPGWSPWRCSVIGGRLFYGRSSGNCGGFCLICLTIA